MITCDICGMELTEESMCTFGSWFSSIQDGFPKIVEMCKVCGDAIGLEKRRLKGAHEGQLNSELTDFVRGMLK